MMNIAPTAPIAGRLAGLTLAGLFMAACGDEAEPLAAADAGVSPDPDAGFVVDVGPMDQGVEPECTANADCAGDTPFCDTEAGGVCAPPPRAGALGWGDGAPQTVRLETIHRSQLAEQATDLEFSNVDPRQLWVVHRYAPNDLPCETPPNGQSNGRQTGCASLQGSTTTIFDPGEPEQSETWIMDFNAWHFMRRPPAIAFGVDGFFATCGEARTGNYLDQAADFIGPTLWTSDPSIYQNYSRTNPPPAGWNGTHMDMLHQTPECVGIAHDQGNAYWLVNGQVGALDWYDFKADHGPGQDYHGDGQVRRYVEGQLSRVPHVPSHLTVHDGKVYVADTGNGRVLAFDPTGAVSVGSMVPNYEDLAVAEIMGGGTLSMVVAPGTLEQPSGLEIHDDILYVSDHATSRIHAFELDGTPIRSLDTGLPPGSLAGLAFSPSGQLHFVDVPNAAVIRVVPQ